MVDLIASFSLKKCLYFNINLFVLYSGFNFNLFSLLMHLQYWAHRITYCAAPSAAFPRVFCWVYRHEGRRLKPELRCHAVLCQSAQHAQRIVQQLRDRLHVALLEFKRDKVRNYQFFFFFFF